MNQTFGVLYVVEIESEHNPKEDIEEALEYLYDSHMGYMDVESVALTEYGKLTVPYICFLMYKRETVFFPFFYIFLLFYFIQIFYKT